MKLQTDGIRREGTARQPRTFDRAIADYDAAIVMQCQSVAALYGRSEAYRPKNDLVGAFAVYERPRELNKNLARAYGDRARSCRGKADFDNALADFDETVKLDLKSALTHMDRGSIYQTQGDFERAIADYDEAIQIDPNDARTARAGPEADDALTSQLDRSLGADRFTISLDFLMLDSRKGRG